MPEEDQGQAAAAPRAPEGSSPARRSVPFLLILLAATAVLSVIAQLNDFRRLPHRDVLAEGAQALHEHADENTVVLFRPTWFNDARIGTHGLDIHPGSPLDPLELARWSTVLVAHPDAWTRRVNHELSRFASGGEVVFRGPRWQVQRFTLNLEREVNWDALHSLADARIRRGPEDGGGVLCRLRRGREWHCGRTDPWVYVADTWREMEDLRYQWCIALAVPHDGEVMELIWDDIRPGSTLRIRAGNDVHATRSHRGGPVRMRVEVDEAQVWHRVFGPREEPYLLEDVQLPEGRERVRLRVLLDSPDALDRFFCFRIIGFDGPSVPSGTNPG